MIRDDESQAARPLNLTEPASIASAPPLGRSGGIPPEDPCDRAAARSGRAGRGYAQAPRTSALLIALVASTASAWLALGAGRPAARPWEARSGAARRAAAPSEVHPPAIAPPTPRPQEPSPAASAPDVPTPTPLSAPPVCYDCFWTYQPASLREDLKIYYAKQPLGDPLLDADRRYLLARMNGSHEDLCAARNRFAAIASTLAGSRRLLAVETLAFTAQECGASPEEAFAVAARAAREADESWKSEVYEHLSHGDFQPPVGDAVVAAGDLGAAGATDYVLGESAIHVAKGERIGVQIERTVRDWLSNQFLYDLSGGPPRAADVLPYHEGARLSEILAGLAKASPRVEPLSGALAVRTADGRWLAPDEQGVFRYEVLPDKVQYPTTRAWRDVALLVDTHGISSLVERAVHGRAGLVIGCGDSPAKMAAAAHLASLGTDVYFPCDRFVSEVLGYEGTGRLVGSGPVHAVEGGVVIGDQPVAFRVAETLVAEDANMRGPFQYYDAPARYFRKLARLVPLRIETVEVDGPGQSERVIARARRSEASAIAVRVQTREDAGPVRAWLKESPEHRAVLFHTAAYPEGYALFREFPKQTTFGDPRPRFLGADAIRADAARPATRASVP